MIISFKYLTLLVAFVFIGSCNQNIEIDKFCDENLDFAGKQIESLAKKAKKEGQLPRALTSDGGMQWASSSFDWTEGFFPGTCWYMFKYTKNNLWKDYAESFQNSFIEHRHLTTNHDLGFVFNCSFGNEYKLTGDSTVKNILIDAGSSLITRFNPQVGCIKSWDVKTGWQSKRGWEFPVIIDNMMNLELLFELTEITGDNKYREVAVSHANTTMKNQFRKDGSSYHVVDYDSITGAQRSRQTAQGFAHESAWARGQAWGLYGYTVCYRYTKDRKYLDKANEIAGFILNHKNLPHDMVPYWDFNAPKIPNEPRDVSAAAIIASALIELSEYTSEDYLSKGETILRNLSSDYYKAKLDENNNFILKHSVGSIPHNSEIDVPLVYADYYYVEALIRLKQIEDKKLAVK